MQVVVADWESLYDSKSYTLSKMTTESYVRDPRFEAHGCAFKFGPNLPAKWWNRHELPELFKQIDWSDVFLIHHHAQFDGLINSHHYNVHPKMYGCTLSMARLMLGNHLGVSLEAVRKHFGMPGKTTPYNLFDGKHWDEMPAAIQKQIGDGACDEVESIYAIFCRFLQEGFPQSQLEVIDILVKMFVEPKLQGDTDVFAKIWEDESKRKTDILKELDITEADLQSSDRFAQLLRDQGVEPATKDGKKGDIYAFAKTDEFMKDLQEDEDPIVRSLAEARLGVKSTILQTRAETLGWMTQRGPLCVYIRPYGAKTTRPSGGDRSNFLNFKKADPDMPPEKGGTSVKEGIYAPDGYLIAPIDSSQVECRLLNFVAGQDDVIEKFRTGDDPYVRVASEFYGYPVNKKDHPTQRQVGKVIELQAGYGSGGEKIRATLRNKAGILITVEEGLRARNAYRQTHPAVTELWKAGGRMLARLAGGPPLQWGPVELRDHRMWLPNGACLIYDTLQFYRDHEKGEEYWRVKTRKGWEKLYGAKLVENLCQALAWCLVSEAMVRINRLGYRILNAPYDELLVLIPKDGNEEKHLERCMAEMKLTPNWLPGLPLDCEGGLSERYAK